MHDDFDINHVASFVDLEFDSNDDSLQSPRRRFNSGFHDGSIDASWDENPRDVSRHFDPVYAVAYLRGHQDYGLRGARAESSDEAWEAFRTHVIASRSSVAATEAADKLHTPSPVSRPRG